jgi:uncharacterized coiled-coil protein SlyX
VDAAHQRPLLGEVLVLEGLLTEEELAAALAEQRRTGERLGTILVASGVLAGPTLAMALADQYGSAIQTEHGWATGWARTSSGLRSGDAGTSQPAPRSGAPEIGRPAPPHESAAGADAGSEKPNRPSDVRRAQEPALDELARAVDAKRQELEALTAELERVKRELQAGRESNGPHEDGTATIDEPDRLDFVVIGVVDGRYAVHLGRGTPPAVGAHLRLPHAPDQTFVVARDRWRRCLYLESAEPG